MVELVLFLHRIGAHMELSPDRRIVIEGVPWLRRHQPAGRRLAWGVLLPGGRADHPGPRFGCTAPGRTG